MVLVVNGDCYMCEILMVFFERVVHDRQLSYMFWLLLRFIFYVR